MIVDPEFALDDEPATVAVEFREALVEFVRREAELRRTLQGARLDRQSDAKAEEDFLRRLIAVKEKRCEQFLQALRERRASGPADGETDEVRAETEKWLQRLERLQSDLDLMLERYGVTRYEPSGCALPERDDVKGTTPTEGREPGTIVTILKPGYLWRGQLLRAAEVLVAQ